MEGSNLSADRGLKKWLFWDWKVVVWGFSIICSYVSSFCWFCVTICRMGLCTVFGLKFGGLVIARLRKFRETSDNGWFWGRFGIFGAVGVVSTLLCSSLYVFVHLKVFYWLMMKKFQKILRIVYVLHLLGGLLVCV